MDSWNGGVDDAGDLAYVLAKQCKIVQHEQFTEFVHRLEHQEAYLVEISRNKHAVRWLRSVLLEQQRDFYNAENTWELLYRLGLLH